MKESGINVICDRRGKQSFVRCEDIKGFKACPEGWSKIDTTPRIILNCELCEECSKKFSHILANFFNL